MVAFAYMEFVCVCDACISQTETDFIGVPALLSIFRAYDFL